MRILKQLTKRIILAYFVAGLVYSVAGYVHRSIIGKQEVFSLLIGIPMDVIGWPGMVYADLKHIGTIGVKAQPFLALISIVIMIAIFVRKELLLRKSMR
ncbi:hypothetical protein Tmath_1508 [Thermoanaerobacter mathranii subsp. mathranii str. A3]|uniref:Uncharacterized protein n=1 Tax=Thermoanaerobacter mathranii subsp. mathranii (strain DSM 11426 / CCUG 53645 / CIP 108742 / A3) TaxID=583358 RepID=A0ABM5LQV2_THEM3|nr:hypothetical protein [Thermoanaerobacter mathranii]ADH61219.1 hypothetical protein Tmath_1508 [Thermoanaerobacter mathranii subsp. mathranii str. A3]